MDNRKVVPISESSAEYLIETENRLEKYDGPDRVVSSAWKREDEKNNKKNNLLFATGIQGLDAALGGIETGELIAIGGPTKNGKTLLAQTLTVNLAAKDVACLWFTFEVPVNQFLNQIPEVTSFYLPNLLKQSDVNWLRDRIWEAKLKYNARVVFIDNLHHLIDFITARNISMDIGVVIRALKRMAIELNVAILVLCHSRKPELEKNGTIREVSEWDLRDSSFIPQECDATVMVQRQHDFNEFGEVEFNSKSIVKVCLSRRTGNMGKIIHMEKMGQVLVEDFAHQPVRKKPKQDYLKMIGGDSH